MEGLSNPSSSVLKDCGAQPGFNFSAFKAYFPTLHPVGFPLPSDAFLAWLIGFSEGDGCFLVNKRKLVELKVGQGAANVMVLHFIKKT
jgi:hypothetical protein